MLLPQDELLSIAGEAVIDPSKFAEWVSAEAKAAFLAGAPTPPLSAEIGTLRRHYDALNARWLEVALSNYPVEIAPSRHGGVPTHTVTPAAGKRDERVLLCLHGGAFMWGSGAGALLEAVPLAAEMGCEVVAVDYRLAPEHACPAAVEDVLAVYAEVRSLRPASAIGIYGCSAGGMLTAQAVARMIAEAIPVPGAIAMLHGTGLDFAGDLAESAAAFASQEGAVKPPSAAQLPYFAASDLADALVLPGNHPEMLGSFPPALLITATRDFAASACSVMHRRLLAAGVETRFVMFDGLGHAHHMQVELPESRETFTLMRRFFQEHLRR
jgi:acetyl esterase/lipase